MINEKVLLANAKKKRGKNNINEICNNEIRKHINGIPINSKSKSHHKHINIKACSYNHSNYNSDGTLMDNRYNSNIHLDPVSANELNNRIQNNLRNESLTMN